MAIRSASTTPLAEHLDPAIADRLVNWRDSELDRFDIGLVKEAMTRRSAEDIVAEQAE